MSDDDESPRFLKEGDIIEIREGHEVYVELPEHFVYLNCKGVMNRTDRTEVCVGEIRNGFDTSCIAGRYIVHRVVRDGGGSQPEMNGTYSDYPNGHHVWAKSADPESAWKVSFYQSGSFTAMIRPKDIQAVGKARCKWEVQP